MEFGPSKDLTPQAEAYATKINKNGGVHFGCRRFYSETLKPELEAQAE